MICHQDKINRSEKRKIKKEINKKGGEKEQKEKDEFFLHFEMQDDSVHTVARPSNRRDIKNLINRLKKKSSIS